MNCYIKEVGVRYNVLLRTLFFNYNWNKLKNVIWLWRGIK